MKFPDQPLNAFDIADELTEALRHLAGGSEIYIPKPCLHRRNAMIISEWNGENAADLAIRYELSSRQIERIVRGQKNEQ